MEREKQEAVGGWGLSGALARSSFNLSPAANEDLGGSGGTEVGSEEPPADPGLGAAGDEGAGGAPQGGEGQPPADPWTQQVPEFARESLGVSTYAELQEMRQAAAMAEAQKELIQTLMQAQASGQAQGPVPGAQPPAPQKFDWYGFGTKEAYLAAYAADPGGTEERKANWLVQRQGGALPKGVQSQLDQLNQHAFRSQWNADLQAVELRYADAKNPAVSGPVNKFIKENGGWLKELKSAYPHINVGEIAFKIADYDRLVRMLKGGNARLQEIRKESGTARTGVGGNVVNQKPAGSHKEAARRALERFRLAGGAVTADMEAYVERMAG